ncbi:uncharacterized protein CPUR_08656 [Claviceps purpurea 20.1]|uniref:F-box domain-containing protein n=1 Tax=Claviceps purpurea (strain 20.1) TaxID=1111077 RepID=M1WDC5_CLAP2|nr:uncharacterized protein CPUR_08656 [Claviceps purpurea 20.1]
MDSTAREAPFMARDRDADESRCLMALLPPETKMQIISHICTQQSLSRLGQSCRAWYEVANEELYKRDSRENNSFAIKWMAARAVDEQTTDSALRTLEISRRWGGQINAVNRRLCRARSKKDQRMYEMSTALHFAVFLGNMRLTKTLLDMNASLEITCSTFLWKSMGSEEVLRRINYFLFVFGSDGDIRFGSAFPVFLAFIQRNADMCKLLVEHGAGREALIVYYFGEPQAMSILHFAAADRTTDYRQWQCLFDGFREYIDEPCPRDSQSAPLHIALIHGCTQGMQIAVESGADKEARNSALRTPLYLGILGIPRYRIADPKPFEEHTRCLRKFVELGASVNPDGDSLIGLIVKRCALFPVESPQLRPLIHFLLEHHADINETFTEPSTNMVNEIIDGISRFDDDPPALEILKELLSHLVDRGLNLTIPVPGLPSPLCRVLVLYNAKPEWLFDLLCENGATIHEREVDSAFLYWCETPRLWEENKYHMWWQNPGQEDEMFLKWCEHPYNACWWQHVKHISRHTVTLAYGAAFKYEDRKLYDILTHLPLPGPFEDVLVKIAFVSLRAWSWRQVVLREFEDDFFATWSLNCRENLIHLTVRLFIEVEDYSVAEATWDILHLRDKGVEMTSRNSYGETPLEILLGRGSYRDGLMELAAVLEGKVQELT